MDSGLNCRWRRRWRAVAGGLSLALILALPGCFDAQPTPAPEKAGAPPATAVASPSPTRATPAGAERKVDTILLDLLLAYRVRGAAGAEEYARQRGLLTPENDIQLTLALDTEDTQPVEEKIRQMGGRVTGTYGSAIDVLIPLDVVTEYRSGSKNFLQDLAEFRSVRDVQLTEPLRPSGRLDQARVVTEGLRAIGADRWHEAGFRGRGVKIGIVDVGFKGYRALIGRELPASIDPNRNVREFGASSLEKDVHGTACAEIIHAIAPEAELYFASISTSVDTRRAIDWLVHDVGVNIINASVGTHTARGDGTGFAAAGADAARQRGVLFVASAGNEADQHWGGSFVDRNGNGLHEFAPGAERLEIAGVNDFRVLLRWDDWRGPSINLDLELLDEAGNVVATSRNAQGPDGKAFPLELLPWRAPRATRFFVQVRAIGAARDVRLDVFVANGSVVQPVAAGSVSTPGDALGALTVGATDARSDQLESYSSRGPTLDGRFKPEVTAPTNVSTATSTRMGEPFNGTSASTPHVAAAAALLLSARPTLTVDQLFRYFQDGAKDLNQPGIDHETGYGRLQLGDPARIESPPPIAPPAGQSFADDFKDPGSGLPVTSDARYVNGSYRIRVAGGRANVASYPRSFGSFSAQVTAAPQPAESLLVYGLSFWQQSRDEYVTFGVTSDGQYFVARYQRGNWQDLVPWTRHQAIRPNGLNVLKVEAQGSQIRVYANDQLLREVAIPGSRPGILGLNAAGLGAAAGEVTFTNLAVTARP